MSTRSQLTKDLNESLKAILGRRTKILVKYMVKLETKSDKTENRVLIFTPVRIYILIAKVPTKIDCHFHYLDIQSIESKTTNQFSIITVDRTYTFSTTGDAGNFSSNADVILTDLVSAIKQIFPTVPLKYIIRKIDIQPNERETIFSDELRPSDPKNIGPCGGYSTQYACMCDFHSVPYREEVAWDIDTIYLSHDTRILNLRDFDHLDSKDLMAIVSALEYNTFFRGLKASHVRLSHETLERILHVLRRSMWLEELHLEALGLKADFLHKLAISVITNNNPALRTIDLSHNLIEDKGAIHLAGPIAKVSKGLCKLCLSHCGLTSKGVNQMAHSLTLNQSISSSLTHLDLSGNNFKDDINNLYNFLAQPNVLEHLNLSTTDTFLENLFGALLRGCSTHLTYLNVSHNSFSTKKGKEIPPSFKQFFTSSLSLKHLNIACCKLPLEALKNLLLGLACNESTTGLYLDLSGNALGVQGAHVLESCIHGVRVLQSLDISDNHLDIELSSVLNAIGKNPSIQTLHMTRIFTGMKLKHIVQVMDSLVNLIQKDDFPLTELVLSENKLKNDIHDFINALGSNQSLKVLDISGNLMGDVGARLLGKALQINNKLRTIIMDRNNITLQGYSDIVYALENNSSMKNIPFPIFDIAPSLKNHPERTDQIMRKMQEYLQRNSMGLKRPNAQGFRLQHGFLLSSTHQLIDKLISETEETISICRSSSDSGVQRLIDDAENSKQLLPKLQEAIRSEPHPIENKLGRIAIDLKQTVHCYLEEIVETMIRTGIEHCPKTLGNQIVINDLRKTCLEKINISDEFYQNCMLNNAGSEIMNKISEVEQLLTGIISDRGTDEVIDALTRYRRGLGISDSPSMHFQDDSKSLDVDRRSNQSNQDSSDSTIAIRNFDFVSSIGLESPTKLEYLNLATPQLQTKRRSFAHKIRPQSVVENLSLGHIPDFLESQSSRTSFKGSHTAMMMMMKNDENCDSITELPSASFQLQHLVKGRPKRTKTRAPTRPLVTNEASSHPIGEGLEAFFRPGSVTPTTFTTPLVSPTSEECSSLSFADSPTMSRDDNGKNYFTSEESTPILEERKPLKLDRTSPALLKGISVAQSSSAQWATARSRSSDNLEKYSPLIGDRKSPIVNRSGGPQSIPNASSLPPSHQPPPIPPHSSSSSSSKSDESTLQLNHPHHPHHHQHHTHMQSSMIDDKSLHLQITQTNNYDKRRSPSNESIKGGTVAANNSNYDTTTTSTNTTKLPTTPTLLPIKPRPHSVTGNDGKSSNDNHTTNNDMINSTDAIDTGDVELIEGQPGGSIVGITPGAALGGGGSIVGISPGAAIERKSVRDMAAGLNRLGVDIIKVKQPQPLPRRNNNNNNSNSNGSISHIISPNKPLPPLPQSPTSPIILSPLSSSLFSSSSTLTSSTSSTSSSSSSSSSTSSSTIITSNIIKSSSGVLPETRQIAGKKITTLFEETLFEGLQRSSFRQSVLREGQYNKDDAVDV